MKHFHFTAWPDHGVPQGTEVLIQFRGLVRRHIERDGAGAPTVVHCRYKFYVWRVTYAILLEVLFKKQFSGTINQTKVKDRSPVVRSNE